MQTFQIACAALHSYKKQRFFFLFSSFSAITAYSLVSCLRQLLASAEETIDLGAYTMYPIDVHRYSKWFTPYADWFDVFLILLFLILFTFTIYSFFNRQKQDFQTAFLMGISKRQLFFASLTAKILLASIAALLVFFLLFLFQFSLLNFLSHSAESLFQAAHPSEYPAKLAVQIPDNFWHFDLSSAAWLKIVFFASLQAFCLVSLLIALLELISSVWIFKKLRKEPYQYVN